MMNAPVDRVVPTSVAHVSETEGAPAKSLMAGHMTPFIGKPRPQVGLAAIKRPNPDCDREADGAHARQALLVSLRQAQECEEPEQQVLGGRYSD